MTELKSCPFCGGEAELRDFGDKRNPYIFCDGPCSFVMDGDTVEEAIEAWNTRAERTCKPEIENHGDLILTRYPCCGYELKVYRYSPYPEEAFNSCPNCGAKVVE